MDTRDGPPLPGGNSGVVVRNGDTVRRPVGPWSPLVQRLMRELRDAGLPFVPEPRGFDDAGREVIEYVEGDVGIYPMPPWVWSDELLVDVARSLRLLHDASAALHLPTAGWRRPAVDPAEVVCHGDVAPYNAVCRDGRLVALIDWDHARPAPRGWDLGYAAYRWVSLTGPDHPDGSLYDAAEQQRRLRLLCRSYGDVDPLDVVRWAVVRLDDLVELDGPHAPLYAADAEWLRRTYG